MAIHIRVLKIPILVLSLVLLGFLSACQTNSHPHTEKEEIISLFPKDEYGFPKQDFLLINENCYHMDLSSETKAGACEKQTIVIKDAKSIIRVVLPRGSSNTYWRVASNTGKEVNANTLSFPIENKKDFRDGISKEVDVFEVQASLFPLHCKLANINDKESTFSDLEAYDQLTIKLAEH